jgi:glycosyltransferase involved in cell wall biosynthesis
MAKQNVLFFIFRLHGGGAERVVSNLSMAFAEEFNVKIAVFDRVEKTYAYKGELIKIDLPFSENPGANNPVVRGVRLWTLIRELRKIKKLHRIGTTVSFGEQASIINVLSKGEGKVVLSVRTLLSNEIQNTPKMNILRPFIKSLYNRAHHIIVTSKVAAADLVQNFTVAPDKLKVIYNYIDQAKVNDSSNQDISDPFLRQLFDQPVLLNVGRINHAKGQWLLLDLMRNIKQLYPGYKLVIIGAAEKGDELKDQLVARAKELGLSLHDNTGDQPPTLEYDVYLLGFQDNPYRYMRFSRVLLFPSVFEGFPNTVLEAMQCGLPVITADCHSGPREIMAPDSDLATRAEKREYTPYGILCPALRVADIAVPVPVEITEEWTLALSSLLNDETMRQRIIQNGYKRVKEFDKDTILGQWKSSLTAE